MANQPIGKVFTGGVQIVNGWNNIEDNNSGKTMGFVGNFGWLDTPLPRPAACSTR